MYYCVSLLLLRRGRTFFRRHWIPAAIKDATFCTATSGAGEGTTSGTQRCVLYQDVFGEGVRAQRVDLVYRDVQLSKTYVYALFLNRLNSIERYYYFYDSF